MIGSGVFKKIIPMSQTGLSETAILLAWIVAGIITMFGAFTLAGLSSITEETGGVYEYLRRSFGNFFSFLFGWTDFTIVGGASIAALGFIFAQGVNAIIPLPDPLSSLSHVSIGDYIYPFASSGIKILGILAIVFLTWVNYLGVRSGGIVNNIFTSAKILGILLLIGLGLFYESPGTSDLPGESVLDKQDEEGFNWTSVFFAAMLSAFWAYDGWINLSFVTGEIKNPKRNVPLSIIFGVSIAMILYVLVNFSYMQVLPLDRLAAVSENDIGAVVVAKQILGRLGETLIAVLIIVSVFGTLNALIMAHARVHFRMAQEKYFFRNVAKVHPTYRSPYVALVYTMIWSSILVVSGTFDTLTNLAVFASFLFYTVMAIALVKMKRNGTIKENVAGYPIIPLVYILFSIGLLLNTLYTEPIQSLIGVGLVLTGIPFYYYFQKKRNSPASG